MKTFHTTITNYSCYKTQDYYIEDFGENVASVFDKLITLAARKCDRYASDVFWDMKRLYDCIERKEKFDKLIYFRENGVYSVNVSDYKEYNLYDAKILAEAPCIWRLEHKLTVDDIGKTIWITTLTRVKVNVEFSKKGGE